MKEGAAASRERSGLHKETFAHGTTRVELAPQFGYTLLSNVKTASLSFAKIVVGPQDWATSFHLMLLKRGAEDLLDRACLFQDTTECFGGWFLSVTPDVCIEVFLITSGVAGALSFEPGSLTTY